MRDLVSTDYSIVSIDLPFHGKTDWDAAMAFESNVLWNIIDQVCMIHEKGAERVELAGFSLGGRVVLGLLDHRPEQVEKAILIAPDGVKFNIWYWLSTQTGVGQALFRYTIKNPRWLFSVLAIGKYLHIVNQSIFKFTRYYLQEAGSRKILYDRWMAMRRFRSRPGSLKNTINKHKTSLLLIYGTYDRIMPPIVGTRFCRDISDHCQLELLSCGHQILQPKNKKFLQQVFRKWAARQKSSEQA
jgi:pimeloyl-ACP methyl ester carboxylesterase